MRLSCRSDENNVMSSPSPEVARLLAGSPKNLPLTRAALQPHPDARTVRMQEPTVLFPGARNSTAALAGLLLRAGCWGESHEIAQDIPSADGSYWHGIIHRMEPDPSNAAYWFRRAGSHAIFPDLHRRATEILEPHGVKHWRLKAEWDPFLFIDWCGEASAKGGDAESVAVAIQMAEWELLFDWCAASR